MSPKDVKLMWAAIAAGVSATFAAGINAGMRVGTATPPAAYEADAEMLQLQLKTVDTSLGRIEHDQKEKFAQITSAVAGLTERYHDLNARMVKLESGLSNADGRNADIMRAIDDLRRKVEDKGKSGN
jgi:hypothetical protein